MKNIIACGMGPTSTRAWVKGLKLAALAILLITVLSTPAFSQHGAVPVAILSPVTILGAATDHALRESVSQDSLRRGRDRLFADARIADLRRIALHDRTGATIHFDVGRSEIRSDAVVALDEKLELLRRVAAVRIRIEGQADAPNWNASNLALAQRRATATKLWLVSRGIAADRIEAVGFGASRPTCEESHEFCWWQNQRDGFVIVAGTGTGVQQP